MAPTLVLGFKGIGALAAGRGGGPLSSSAVGTLLCHEVRAQPREGR